MAAAARALNPERIIIGIETEPEVTTFATALPEMMPNSDEPTTATFASPPR